MEQKNDGDSESSAMRCFGLQGKFVYKLENIFFLFSNSFFSIYISFTYYI